MKNQIERRFVAQEFRVSAEGESPKVGGYALVFDSASYELWPGVTETIDPHALDGLLDKNPDVRALFNHDPSLILGRTTAGTLRLSVDARGLDYEFDPPNTQAGRDLLVSMQRGDITQSSFGFMVGRDQWTDNPDGTITRRILEISDLLDVSPVTFPAYSAATSGIRSLPASMPAEMRSRISKRSDGDSLIAELCGCDCDACSSGDCLGCSDDDCNDPNCDCAEEASARSARATSATRESMAMQLRVAEARAK